MNRPATMTSKERVLAAAVRQQPDRVPVDFSANPWVLRRLSTILGVPDHESLLDALGVDIVDLRGVVDPIYRGPAPWCTSLPGGVEENIWGMRTRLTQSAIGPEQMYCDFRFRRTQDLAELENHPWPSVDDFDFSDFGARLQPWRDRAVMASGASIWQHPSFLRGLDELLMDVAAASAIGDFLLDKFTDFYVAYFDRMFSAAPAAVDILRIADDIGMQDRLLFSPDTVRRCLVPRIARLIDMAHAHGVKVMFHSCGSIRPIIPDLLDAGIDILDPIQVSARDMDPSALKRDFGSRLCFHGAVDTQYLLPHASPAEVARAVRQMIDTLGPGGYIVAPSHVLQMDVPLENIRALYSTAAGRPLRHLQTANFDRKGTQP